MKEKSCSINLVIGDESFSLNTEKILIGSADHCDIKLSHKSISYYQAILFTDAEGKVVVLDLESQNGTYINAVKIGAKSSIFPGDTLSFGKVHCEITESFSEDAYIVQDTEVEIFEDLQSHKIYIPEQMDNSEVLIDDEFCNIVFKDEEFIPQFKNPVANLKVDEEEYVSTENMEEAFDILEFNDGNCVQVTTSLSGNMLEQYYYPIQDGSVKMSPKQYNGYVEVDFLDHETELFRVESGELKINAETGFSMSQVSMDITGHDVIVLTKGTFQVFIEIATVPNKLLHISSLRRDKAFFYDTGKKFAAILLPMLLLLLVDFTIEKEKPVKKLSIIYKKPTTANVDNKKVASENPNNTKKDTGHKKQKQPDKKISFSKAGQKQQPKKSVQKKVAKAPSKATKKAKAKTKAYKFEMATNVNSLFSSSKSVAVSNSRSVSNVASTASVSGSLNTQVNGTSSAQVGTLGSDSSGRSTASYGSKGLSSKFGRNTAYIQTETVVLGAMDPELLRKILQQYLPQFRHCYQQELAYNSEDIKGIVDLNFEIAGTGKVGKIKIKAKDSRFSKRGINCMTKVLAIIDFPSPKGGGRVAVRQPLSFFSEKEKG